MPQTYSSHAPTEFAKTLEGFAQRALNIQAELGDSLVQVNQHWIQQCQAEWMEALDLVRRFASHDTAVEKVGAIQTWLKGATERGARDASYAIEIGRALGSIELKLFASQPDVQSVESQKAA